MAESRIVSVFGSAQPKPETPRYEEAYRVGELLAEHGHTVMTGGYAGTMEATSKGAKEAGGHVIGVTVGQIERKFGTKKNPYVDEVIHYDTLYDRLHHLVAKCSAAIALPGGIGTLSEVALTWSMIQIDEIERMPFILLGARWHDAITRYYGDGEFIRAEYLHLLNFAQSPEEAVTMLDAWK
jgi:uncharacterized protein (TIGR00725 family)